MNTVASQTRIPAESSERQYQIRRAQVAAWLGAATAVAFTVVTLLATITEDGHPFRHAADYWYTGLGMLPAMGSALVLVLAIHSLQRRRDGRLGRVGTLVMSVGLVVFMAMGAYALVIGKATSLGPTYLLATLATFVGLTLFVAGSWGAGLLPRWLLIVWLVAWLIGGPFAQSATPLLLAAAFVTIALLLPNLDR
ncbi:MAG: hypothetical protein ACR2MU_03270 [Gaiellaceae bacterium]